MPKRVRKLIGAVAMLAFVCVYGLVVMLIAQTDHIRHASPIPQAVFFLATGLAWILPLMPLIKWMERPDSGEPASPR